MRERTLELDDNLTSNSSGTVTCKHCDANVGTVKGGFLDLAIWREQPSSAAGNSVVRADPALFVDRKIVLRQAMCPSCLTLLLTEVVPEDEPHFRSKSVIHN